MITSCKTTHSMGAQNGEGSVDILCSVWVKPSQTGRWSSLVWMKWGQLTFEYQKSFYSLYQQLPQTIRRSEWVCYVLRFCEKVPGISMKEIFHKKRHLIPESLKDTKSILRQNFLLNGEDGCDKYTNDDADFTRKHSSLLVTAGTLSGDHYTPMSKCVTAFVVIRVECVSVSSNQDRRLHP